MSQQGTESGPRAFAVLEAAHNLTAKPRTTTSRHQQRGHKDCGIPGDDVLPPPVRSPAVRSRGRRVVEACLGAPVGACCSSGHHVPRRCVGRPHRAQRSTATPGQLQNVSGGLREAHRAVGPTRKNQTMTGCAALLLMVVVCARRSWWHAACLRPAHCKQLFLCACKQQAWSAGTGKTSLIEAWTETCWRGLRPRI